MKKDVKKKDTVKKPIDKKEVKHYFTVGGILCAIGAGSALLIGLTNLATKDTIAQNNLNNQINALSEIYSKENYNHGETYDIADKNYNLLQKYWNPTLKVEDSEFKTPGWIFQAHGADESNYGKITILIEITADKNVGRFAMIENTESYAGVVQSQYVDQVNKGTRPYEDVSCGATKGATLIKNMANQAKDYCEKVLKWNKDTTKEAL